MAKYKFIKDKANPSDDEIRSKMNFNKVFQQGQHLHNLKHATRPAYKKPLFLGFIILLGTLCLMFLLEEPSSNKKTPAEKKSIDSTFVKDSLSK